MLDVSIIIAELGAGIASFLAPCVVPLVPAYMGMIAGDVTAVDKNGKQKTPVVPTIVFISGFATVFTALGAVVGSLGIAKGTAEDVIKIVGGLIIIVMGLALLGLFKKVFGREKRLITSLPKLSPKLKLFRPYILGIAFGAAWSPCVGPLLGSALAIASRSGQVLEGSIYLFVYALGIGIPFLVVSLLLASYPSLIGKLARLAQKIEKVTGVLLIILGLLLVTDQYDKLTALIADIFA